MLDAFDIQPGATVSHWQETDANVIFTPGWTKSNINLPWSGTGASNPPELPVSAQESQDPGPKMTLPFRGTAIGWTGYRGPDAGIALVQVVGDEFTALPVVEGLMPAVGDEVFIVASVGDAGRRASSGGITSLEAFDANWEYTLESAIYASAMNPGLGGGPLLDCRGRVAGVVSLNLNEIARFSLAIPIAHYRDHRDELLRFGRRTTRPSRAWLGLYCYTLREHVVIAGLLPGGPAEAAGMAQGDVVVAVGDAKVETRRDFYERLWSHRAGAEVALRIFRDERLQTIAVPSANVEEFFA